MGSVLNSRGTRVLSRKVWKGGRSCEGSSSSIESETRGVWGMPPPPQDILGSLDSGGLWRHMGRVNNTTDLKRGSAVGKGGKIPPHPLK